MKQNARASPARASTPSLDSVGCNSARIDRRAKVKSKSRTGEGVKEGARVHAEHTEAACRASRKYAEYFPRICRIYTIPRQLLPLRAARYLTSRITGREKRGSPAQYNFLGRFYLAICRLTFGGISARMQRVVPRRDLRRGGGESMEEASSFDTSNLTAISGVCGNIAWK